MLRSLIDQIVAELKVLPLDEKVKTINEIKEALHEVSPFRDEPVDCVLWVQKDHVQANDYNPNTVAPPEMELLEVSIVNDGYTQPIVTWPNDEKGIIEVVDGFHRSRVGKESKVVASRIMGYLPVVTIRKTQAGKNDRIASTIRHNRARGKHQVNAMSEIVIELKNRNWSNARISKQLGMDEEEVLRLCQISGLENIFSDADFSKAWEAETTEQIFEPVTDEVDEHLERWKIPNEADVERIFHTYDKWECYRAGFYENKKPGMTDEECEAEYVRILSNPELFAGILEKVISEWTYSCEHYLTNKSMNRLAWLGQAAVCYATGVPSSYKGAWMNLKKKQQIEANQVALTYLNKWLENHNMKEVDINGASLPDRQVELY